VSESTNPMRPFASRYCCICGRVEIKNVGGQALKHLVRAITFVESLPTSVARSYAASLPWLTWQQLEVSSPYIFVIVVEPDVLG